ncbi:MAG TPA: helicase-related protein, partial [Candidatus Kapabacteria bacterium]|nr:helicase-related protein [Candidatus Kapabacteria bacterium]
EADRMLDMGFIHDVRKVINILPTERQTLLFSATISNDIKKLADGVQKNPVVVQIGQRHNPAESVTQYIYDAPREKKLDLLIHILANEHMESVLIFSRTKHGADKIAKRLLREGISTTTIHSNKSQSQRQRALDGFKRGQFKVLVATDIAARGLDVEGISHVINFDTPAFAEDYIHRIGRTGRAEATGDAITFVSRDELDYLRKIERFTKQKFERKQYPGFDYSAKPAPKPEHAAKPASEQQQDQPEVRPDRPQHKAPAHKPPFNRGGQHRNQSDRRKPSFDRREGRPERRDDQPNSSFGRRNDRSERHNPGGQPSTPFIRHKRPHSSQQQRPGASSHRVRSKHYQKPGQQPARRSTTDEIFNPTSAPWKSSDFYAAHPSPIKKHRGKNGDKNRYGEKNSAYAKFDKDGHKVVTTLKKRKFPWNPFKKKPQE